MSGFELMAMIYLFFILKFIFTGHPCLNTTLGHGRKFSLEDCLFFNWACPWYVGEDMHFLGKKEALLLFFERREGIL